jgi:hypothetical protein
MATGLMNWAQILFIWIVASIGFVMGGGTIEESAPGAHFIAGFIIAILFAALAYQIII